MSTEFKTAGERADETQKRVLDLRRRMNALQRELREAEEDNSIAHAELAIAERRNRMAIVEPISESYAPSIYRPEVTV